MNVLLFLRPLRRRLGATGATLALFGISGALHELAISYTAGGGWGGPMLYFLGHGALVEIERRGKQDVWPEWARRLWTIAALLVPLPLLFHAPFRAAFLEPLGAGIESLLRLRPWVWYVDLGLWLAGIGHFCLLLASFQVPSRLGWRDDFAKLSQFNRKVFWTYGGFIVLCIVGFGVLTLVLHDELLRGDRAARGLAAFIGVFWLARVVVDLFYFKHDDWPEGALFVVGHVLLTALFIALSAMYLIVAFGWGGIAKMGAI